MIPVLVVFHAASGKEGKALEFENLSAWTHGTVRPLASAFFSVSLLELKHQFGNHEQSFIR